MSISVITKSYAPDYELCSELNASVLALSSGDVGHDIIVPKSDLAMFSRLAGPRTKIYCDSDFLPRTFVNVPLTNLTVNLRKPFPPVRGWIQQQVIKLAAVARSDLKAVLTADSDVQFIRPFGLDTYVRDGAVRFYRNPDQIDDRLPRHVTWHRVARKLLGLPSAEPPFPDYISSIVCWDPAVVRQMLKRVEAVTGVPWFTAIAGELDFSECILYGVYVDSLSNAAFASDDPLCLSSWSHSPLSMNDAIEFTKGVKPTDVAAVIQSKSNTTRAVRDAAFAALRQSTPKPDKRDLSG